jgi:2-keto-3-deoxy-galactonokinase
LASALHSRFLGPEFFEFSLDAFIYRQVHSTAFAGAVDREREPVQMFVQNLNTHLDSRRLTVMCSMAPSHGGQVEMTYPPFNAAFASVKKGSINPIAQSVAIARKY